MNEHLKGTQTITKQELQTLLAQPGWYLMAEAAVNESLLSAVPEEKFAQRRLYWDEMGQQNSSISPFLLPLDCFSRAEQNITHVAHWGIAVQLHDDFQSLTTDHQIDLIQKHFRAWTLVVLPDDQQVLMRLTDWDIFNVLWRSTDPAQLSDLQGPLKRVAYWQAGNDAVAVREMSAPRQTRPMVMPNRLSERQYQAFSAWGDRRVYQQYRTHLYQHHPQTQNWDDETFNQYLLRNVNSAHQLGFYQQADVVVYLSISLLLGEQFHQSDWAQSILQSPQVIGDQSRMDRLLAEAVNALGEDATES